MSQIPFSMTTARMQARPHHHGRVQVSNSYVEELVDSDRREFRDRYDCCFLWVDVQCAVLHGYVARRVDEMCARGLVDEVAAAFNTRCTDYSRGIWRAIGMPELDAYLRWSSGDNEGERTRLLAAAIEDMKANSRRLSCQQRAKIQRLAKLWGNVRGVDATDVFRRRGDAADEPWQRLVPAPCIDAVHSFLRNDDDAAAAAAAASDLPAAEAVPAMFTPALVVAVAG